MHGDVRVLSKTVDSVNYRTVISELTYRIIIYCAKLEKGKVLFKQL